MITHTEDGADQHVEVALVSEQQAIVPGQKFLMGVRFVFFRMVGTPTGLIPATRENRHGSRGSCQRDFKRVPFNGRIHLACRLLLSQILAMNIKFCSP
jgi:hypothetical protein